MHCECNGVQNGRPFSLDSESVSSESSSIMSRRVLSGTRAALLIGVVGAFGCGSTGSNGASDAGQAGSGGSDAAGSAERQGPRMAGPVESMQVA